MRGGAAPDRGLPRPFLLIEQSNEHRRIFALEERNLEYPQRRPGQALALETNHPVAVGNEEAREIASSDRALLMTHCASPKHAVGRPDPAVGADQRNHDSSTGKPIAGRAADQSLDRLRATEPLGAPEAPDEQVVLGTRALDLRRQRRSARDHPVDRSATVAPGRTAGRSEPLDARNVDR